MEGASLLASEGGNISFPPAKVTDVANGGKNTRLDDDQISSFAFDFQNLAAFYDENLYTRATIL